MGTRQLIRVSRLSLGAAYPKRESNSSPSMRMRVLMADDFCAFCRRAA